MIISIFNGVIVFLVAVLFSFHTAQNKYRLPLISWSFLAIALIYGMGSAIVLTATYNGAIYLGSDVVLRSIIYWPFYGPLVLVLIVGIFLGWKIPIRKKSTFERLSRLTFESSKQRLLHVAYFFLITGFILRWLYVRAFGGFSNYLEYSRAIRSAVFEIDNPFSFLQPFSVLAILSSYFFWSLWINNYKKLQVNFGLLLSFLFSIYILISQSGRIGFVLYLGNFFLAYLYVKNVRPRLILLLSTLAFPVAVLLLYYGSLYFNLKASDSVSYYFIKEISFVFVSFFIQITEGSLFRAFIDFLVAPTHLLPSSLTLGLYENASETNTILVSGAPKGTDGVTGGIPVDILTLGLMQLNVFGILPIGVLFGFFIKRLDYLLDLIKDKALSSILIVHFSLRLAFIGLLYAHPPHFMGGIFVLILMLSTLYLFSFISRVKIRV